MARAREIAMPMPGPSMGRCACSSLSLLLTFSTMRASPFAREAEDRFRALSGLRCRKLHWKRKVVAVGRPRQMRLHLSNQIQMPQSRDETESRRAASSVATIPSLQEDHSPRACAPRHLSKSPFGSRHTCYYAYSREAVIYPRLSAQSEQPRAAGRRGTATRRI